jgi:ssDNA-binding Zn-finger/Zn-ribbon topoisomerase 1
MTLKRLNLTYALKDEIITHVSEVDRGLKCGCVCPACGERLIAKKGQKVTHHFAHQTTKDCEYGYESSLHLAAKEILSKAKKLVIPPVYVHFPNSYKEKLLLSDAKEITIDRVELEQRFNNVVPDVVVYAEGKCLFIEVFVTHCVDDEKLDKLRAADISTIEINLSKIDHSITTEELVTILTEDSEVKYWKYNARENKYLRKFYRISEKRNIISRGYAQQVDGCPIAARSWHGKPYANFIDDCLYCQYCIAHSFEGGMLCSGRQRISSIKDFNIPEDVRIKESIDALTAQRYNLLTKWICPNCGGQLIRRTGKYGGFLGCSHYPHCKFTASVDESTGEIKMET